MKTVDLSSDPRWSLDPQQMSLTSPWLVGAAAAFVVAVAVTRTGSRHPLRTVGIVIVATVGWFVAVGVGAVGTAVACGWAAATSPKQTKRGAAHRRHVFVWTSVTVLSVLACGWAWAMSAWWIAAVVPVAAVVVVTGTWWWERAHRPVLDPTRLFSARDRDRKLREQNGCCNYADEGCPSSVDQGDLFEGDHVVPWAHGGRTVYENLQMLCHTCNHLKSDLDDRSARRKVHGYWKTHRRVRRRRFLVFSR